MKPEEQVVTDQPNSLNQRETLENLKKSVSDVVIIHKELKDKAMNKMSNSLFGKFLGRAPPLKVVKNSLSEMWRGMGPF